MTANIQRGVQEVTPYAEHQRTEDKRVRLFPPSTVGLWLAVPWRAAVRAGLHAPKGIGAGRPDILSVYRPGASACFTNHTAGVHDLSSSPGEIPTTELEYAVRYSERCIRMVVSVRQIDRNTDIGCSLPCTRRVAVVACRSRQSCGARRSREFNCSSLSPILPHRSLLAFQPSLTGPPSAGLAGRSGAGDGARVDLG
jgi:hypothetical protein